MADTVQFVFSVLLFLTVCILLAVCENTAIEYSEDRKPCTYFESTRYAKYEPGLVNCSWYVSNSCCKRTEVTSVFSSNMMPLYEASIDCSNRMNYLMCYFCSPDQFHWYKNDKLHVCEAFCDSIYQECKAAFFDGSQIGEFYSNGTAFCEAQNFEVVNSKYCFKFDPTVFDAGTRLQSSYVLQILMFVTFSAIGLWGQTDS